MFLIDRMLYYKFLAPVVDEALRMDLIALCVHDYTSANERFVGIKADQFPTLSCCPQFRFGQVMLRCRKSDDEILELITAHDVRWIFALHGPSHYGLDPEIAKSCLWVQMQHGADSFLESGGIADATVFAAYSEDWLLHHLGAVPGNAYAVGCPALDAVSQSKSETREKYRIAPDFPVVTYFANDHPRLCWVPGILDRFWYRYVFCDDLWKSWRWVPECLSRIVITELTLVRRLRTYAQSIGGVLVIKSRSKRKLTRTLTDHADVVLYDETVYPATNVELMSISSLVVSITSTAKLEAEYFGVPAYSLFPSRLSGFFRPFLERLFPKPLRPIDIESVEDFVALLDSGGCDIVERGLNYSPAVNGPRDGCSSARLLHSVIARTPVCGSALLDPT